MHGVLDFLLAQPKRTPWVARLVRLRERSSTGSVTVDDGRLQHGTQRHPVAILPHPLSLMLAERRRPESSQAMANYFIAGLHGN